MMRARSEDSARDARLVQSAPMPAITSGSIRATHVVRSGEASGGNGRGGAPGAPLCLAGKQDDGGLILTKSWFDGLLF